MRTNILKARKKVSNDFVIGVNIGKNKSTPVEDAVKDYTTCFEKMYDAADYFTVNVSSPNTCNCVSFRMNVLQNFFLKYPL